MELYVAFENPITSLLLSRRQKMRKSLNQRCGQHIKTRFKKLRFEDHSLRDRKLNLSFEYSDKYL